MGKVFDKYVTSQYIDTVRQELSDRIDRLEITDSTNINSLLQQLTSEFTIYPLELKEPQPSPPRETTISARDMFDRQYEKKVFQVQVTIPFDGNRNLFDCHPNAWRSVYLDRSVSIDSTFISATITLDDLDPAKYKDAVAKIVDDLNTNIPGINSEIALCLARMMQRYIPQGVSNET